MNIATIKLSIWLYIRMYNVKTYLPCDGDPTCETQFSFAAIYLCRGSKNFCKTRFKCDVPINFQTQIHSSVTRYGPTLICRIDKRGWQVVVAWALERSKTFFCFIVDIVGRIHPSRFLEENFSNYWDSNPGWLPRECHLRQQSRYTTLGF